MRHNVVIAFLFSFSLAIAQTPENAASLNSQTVPLVIPSGSPLRVYLTKRLPKRLGEPVHAKLLEPLFAFDRQVAPAGCEVLGRVVRLDPVSKMKRTAAILGGDFTPLHQAEVQFDTLVFPGGRSMPLDTVASVGLNTIVPLHPPKARSPAAQNGGLLGRGKQQAQAQIDAAKAKVQGIADMVRGPDKKDYIEDYLVRRLPYHPQWVKRGTRFDAELRQPLAFGTAAVKDDSLRSLGAQPPLDSIAHVRLLTPVDSVSATQGTPVEAVLSQPLSSADGKLIWPEGTRLTGAVTFAHRARWFHRGGQLRFSFQNIELPQGIVRPAIDAAPVTARTQATVASAESSGSGNIKVDDEGGVKATEPKTRFIAPAISILIANKSADNDEGRVGGGSANVGGRTLGGASGFGVLGAAAAQASRTVGTVFGFWGMAVSVYSTIVSKGSEVEFDKNAAMDIRFSGRPSMPVTKFQAAVVHSH